jgi:hypothetical protein
MNISDIIEKDFVLYICVFCKDYSIQSMNNETLPICKFVKFLLELLRMMACLCEMFYMALP